MKLPLLRHEDEDVILDSDLATDSLVSDAERCLFAVHFSFSVKENLAIELQYVSNLCMLL